MGYGSLTNSLHVVATNQDVLVRYVYTQSRYQSPFNRWANRHCSEQSFYCAVAKCHIFLPSFQNEKPAIDLSMPAAAYLVPVRVEHGNVHHANIAKCGESLLQNHFRGFVLGHTGLVLNNNNNILC